MSTNKSVKDGYAIQVESFYGLQHLNIFCLKHDVIDIEIIDRYSSNVVGGMFSKAEERRFEEPMYFVYYQVPKDGSENQ